MTTREQNDFLTLTGPGTPMGALMRRYWIPALLSSEIPEPDCPPVRVKLLGERLIAFRDTLGRVGVMDEFCAHRGVSLWFGRNEENGLRCPYHGWKYDVTGQCIEVPSEPAESGFCNKVKLTSYACAEMGDVIWIYMGPPALKPPPPNFEWATVPGALRSDREQGRHGDRRAPAGDAGQSLLAHHAVGDAVPHHDPALRRQRAQRPRLRADRRRELHVVVFYASSGAAVVGARARGDAQRRRHPRQSHSRLVPSGGQQRQRLHDRPPGAEAPQVLFRREGHRHARRRDPGKHRADPGPCQGEPGLDRQRRHH